MRIYGDEANRKAIKAHRPEGDAAAHLGRIQAAIMLH